MEKSDNTAKLIGALLAGAAIGTAIGFLLAPEKGSDTRKKMMDGAGDLVGKLKDILNTSMDKGTEQAGEQA